MSFPASAQEDANPFPARAEWQEKWQNSLAYTLEALEKLPDSSFHFRPSPGQMSVLEQVQHISGNVYGLSRRFLGYQLADFDESKLREILSAEDLNRQQLTDLITNAYAFGTDAVNSLAPKDWDEIVPNFFAGPRSKRVIVYLLQDHATHHRAQVLMYLRMLELEPPRYRGW
ncbi:MAG: DinB family protein, partial [Bacteroidota bacterium]